MNLPDQADFGSMRTARLLDNHTLLIVSQLSFYRLVRKVSLLKKCIFEK